MTSSKKTFWTETLPDLLPANPLEIAAQWLTQAQREAAQPNPNAMVLATVDSRGYPSARVVLCKEIAAQQGYILFYTNYRSRKGSELELNPRAARPSEKSAMWPPRNYCSANTIRVAAAVADAASREELPDGTAMYSRPATAYTEIPAATGPPVGNS